MSHVDEGTIHAWLDGALAPDDPVRAGLETHIRDCVECRALVEAERRVRDRAAAVLEQVRPDNVRVEPFEKMLAARRTASAAAASGASRETEGGSSGGGANRESVEAGATPDIAPRRTFRIPMTIAATLVLAATATWMARRVRSSAVQPRAALEADAAAAPSPAGASADRMAGPTRNAPATIGAAPSEQKVTAERETNVGQSRQRVAADARFADTATGLRSSAARAAEPPPVVAIAEPPARSGTETRRIDSLARATSATGRNEQVVAQEAARADVVAGGQLADAIADPFAERVLASTIDWQAVSDAEATRRLGRSPASVDGLRLDSVHAAVVDGRAVIRLLQTTPAGERVELLEWTPSPASAIAADEQPKAAAPRPSTEAGAMAKRDVRAAPLAMHLFRVPGAVVIVRAALPPDSLAALARRARQ
jgi:hypothetical protein